MRSVFCIAAVIIGAANPAIATVFDFRNSEAVFAESVAFMVDGIKLTVTGDAGSAFGEFFDNGPQEPPVERDPRDFVTGNAGGLGVQHELPDIDNFSDQNRNFNSSFNGPPSFNSLRFEFDQFVTLDRFIMSDFEPPNGQFELSPGVIISSPNGGDEYRLDVGGSFSQEVRAGDRSFSGQALVSNVFTITSQVDFGPWGVEAPIDSFLVQQMHVTSVIPLPAAGWMLLAGIGGLAALGRRKHRA